jgi:hypothetical protein
MRSSRLFELEFVCYGVHAHWALTCQKLQNAHALFIPKRCKEVIK